MFFTARLKPWVIGGNHLVLSRIWQIFHERLVLVGLAYDKKYQKYLRHIKVYSSGSISLFRIKSWSITSSSSIYTGWYQNKGIFDRLHCLGCSSKSSDGLTAEVSFWYRPWLFLFAQLDASHSATSARQLTELLNEITTSRVSCDHVS